MNRSIDSRSDLYSLGVTFYQLLTGRLPFEASDAIGWVYCHVARKPPPPDARPSLHPRRALRHRPQAARQGARRTLPERLGPRARSRTLPAAKWRETGEIAPFPLGERDVSDRFLIPQTALRADRGVRRLAGGVRARGRQRDARAGAGVRLLGHRQVVGGARAAPADRRASAASSSAGSSSSTSATSLTSPSSRRSARSCSTSWPRAPDSIAAWRLRIQAALGENGQLIVDLIPRGGAGHRPAAAGAGAVARRGREPAAPGAARVRGRVRDAGTPAGDVPRRPAVGGPGQPEAARRPGRPTRARGTCSSSAPTATTRSAPRTRWCARSTKRARRARRSATLVLGPLPEGAPERARRRHGPLLAPRRRSRSPAWCARRPAATPSSSSSS